MTRFSKLHPDGSETDIRHIPQSAMKRCDHFIMTPEHYRADNSCRCNDPNHKEMQAWGYTWDANTKRWTAGDDDATR